MAVISFALPSQINICVDTDTVVTPCRLESEKNRWICIGTNKLYRNKVLVHPDCVEIPLNKVPTNLLPPSEPQDKSATSRLCATILHHKIKQEIKAVLNIISVTA